VSPAPTDYSWSEIAFTVAPHPHAHILYRYFIQTPTLLGGCIRQRPPLVV